MISKNKPLSEGMKIAHINRPYEEYRLILSSEDECLYGVNKERVIKLDEINEDEMNDWFCTCEKRMDDEIQCLEFSKSQFKDDTSIVSFEDFCIYSFSHRIDKDFKSVEMRYINMKREDYLVQKGFAYEIELRNKIKAYYEQKKAKS